MLSEHDVIGGGVLIEPLNIVLHALAVVLIVSNEPDLFAYGLE